MGSNPTFPITRSFENGPDTSLTDSDEGGAPIRLAAGPLRGTIAVPGDKSISHRALILAAAMGEPTRISNLNSGRDVKATIAALESLGARVDREGDEFTVRGSRLQSGAAIDCANSGSTARMLLGVCAGANLSVAFDGDASLRARPMEPVAAQLRAFGASVDTTDGRLPLTICGTERIQTRNFILLAPSAQVKTALLFAGLYARVPITIAGDRSSRDHTERLLRYLGADVTWNGKSVVLQGFNLAARPIAVPGDLSAAAFFITAATLARGSEIAIADIGVNPTRTGLIETLGRMGADITLSNQREIAGEPVADVLVRSARLRAIAVESDMALRAIDEIPLLAVAAAFADGTTTISGVKDLRSKESDRVAAIQEMLSAVGIRAEPTGSNRLVIQGGTPAPVPGAVVRARDDHRIAMAAAILACAAGPLELDSDQSVAVSFPEFFSELERAQRD